MVHVRAACESWARAGVPTDKLLAAFSPPFIPRTLHRVPVGTACIPTYHSVTQTVFCRILVLSFLFVLGILMQILVRKHLAVCRIWVPREATYVMP